MNTPLLSIVIPTNNRQKYASVIIRTILKNLPNTELIVSDVSMDNTLEQEFMNDIDNQRFRYEKQPAGLDMVSNFESALKLATGEYIVFIGDDDGVCYDIEKVAFWAKKNEIDAIFTTTPVSYYWRGFRSFSYGNRLSESMIVSKFTGACNQIDGKIELKLALHDAGGGLKNMPRVYQGMVSRMICQKIIEKYGSLFGGVSPDIYSASLIATEAQKSFIVDYPFIIPGSSPGSGAGRGAERKHISKLLENDHMRAFSKLEWDERIPAFYSVETVFGYSLLKAYEKLENDSSQFNFPSLYAKCLFYHWSYRRQTQKAINIYSNGKDRLLVYTQIVLNVGKEMGKLTNRVISRISFSKGNHKVQVIDSLENIEVGIDKLQEIIEEENIQFF